jgi:hypothetical protein
VDVIATAIDAASPADDAAEAHAAEAHAADPTTAPDLAAPGSLAGPDPLAGLDPEHQQTVAEFDRELGLDPDREPEDDTGERPHGA